MRCIPTATEIETYRRDGFVAISDLLNQPETAALDAAVEAAMTSMGKVKITGEGGTGYTDGKPWIDEQDTYYANALHQRINLWRISEVVKQRMLGPELGEFTARLAGIGGVRCYHDQALYKPAWGNPTSWHLDNPIWSFTSPDAISVWIALDEATVQNGCLWYLPGSHRLVDRRNAGIDGNFGDLPRRVHPQIADIPPVSVPLPRGGAVFHNGLTAHAAGCNISNRPRRAMTCAYMPEGSVFNGNTSILPPSYVKTLNIGDVLDNEAWVPLVWSQRAAG